MVENYQKGESNFTDCYLKIFDRTSILPVDHKDEFMKNSISIVSQTLLSLFYTIKTV